MFEGNMESGENVRPANGGTGGQGGQTDAGDASSDNGGTPGNLATPETEQHPGASS